MARAEITAPMGATVTFIDPTAVVTQAMSVCTGFINGPVIDVDGESFVSVWAERDNGRESTSVFVHSSNVLKIETAS